MIRRRHACDVLIVGGGPAGLAAGYAAARSGRSGSGGGGLRVTVVDDNLSFGGQIWRGEQSRPSSRAAAAWFEKVKSARLEFVGGARVFQQSSPGRLLTEVADGAAVCEISYEKLILATGACERFLPFPGWTLPNVTGAGGLQAMVKAGLPIEGKRVVVAGTGPLLPAVAAGLRRAGARVLLVAEQAPRARLFKFGLGLVARPAKITQAVKLRAGLFGVPYLTDCWPVAAEGAGLLEGVRLRRGAREWRVDCDYLACGFHLTPTLDAALLVGCATDGGAVRVDEFQRTSAAGVYCAGESTGVGGADLALVEGQIAGHHAAGDEAAARALFDARARHRRFADALDRAFSLRDELKDLPAPQTVVCRCEDVTFGQVRGHASWRAAKLQTRCGMGSCQGRVCGGALEFLLGWKSEQIRPPIFPVSLRSLALTHDEEEEGMRADK